MLRFCQCDRLTFWPKAIFTVAWGNALGNRSQYVFLAEGQIHPTASVIMAFGQENLRLFLPGAFALGYVEQLGQVNTDNIEPLAHPLPVCNVFREDEPGESLPVNEALSNAPDAHDNFFTIPAVFD